MEDGERWNLLMAIQSAVPLESVVGTVILEMKKPSAWRRPEMLTKEPLLITINPYMSSPREQTGIGIAAEIEATEDAAIFAVYSSSGKITGLAFFDSKLGDLDWDNFSPQRPDSWTTKLAIDASDRFLMDVAQTLKVDCHFLKGDKNLGGRGS